jgi:hypothetical protein
MTTDKQGTVLGRLALKIAPDAMHKAIEDVDLFLEGAFFDEVDTQTQDKALEVLKAENPDLVLEFKALVKEALKQAAIDPDIPLIPNSIEDHLDPIAEKVGNTLIDKAFASVFRKRKS